MHLDHLVADQVGFAPSNVTSEMILRDRSTKDIDQMGFNVWDQVPLHHHSLIIDVFEVPRDATARL